MSVFDEIAALGHERVLFGQDAAAGYRGIIAIHSTVLGPALGGTRLWHYASEADALTDALRLSRGMTYKNAVAGLPFGGGKSVILRPVAAPAGAAREALFEAHGRFVQTCGGRYITAEDVGTGVDDMPFIRRTTAFCAGAPDGAGDPSPYTALGVFRAIQACATHRWGSPELQGRRVALQGCGNVGGGLAALLHGAGARLVVTDVDAARAARIANECGGEAVEPDAIYDADADVFAPCALGGIINDSTLPRLKVEIVAGAANNQLLDPRHGDALEARSILYAPDYVANAGGVTCGCVEFLGWSHDEVMTRVRGIYDTVLSVFDIAGHDGVPPHVAADRLAEQRLSAAG